MSVVAWVKRWWSVLIVGWLGASTLQAQTTLFFEGFEGAFPGPWRVGDFEPDGYDVWWVDVGPWGSVAPRTGGWMGYCAGADGLGNLLPPPYQSDMYSYMERDVNLIGQANPVLTFWINVPSIEEGIDSCEVWMDNVTLIWSRSTPTVGWQQISLNLSAWTGSIRTIGFWFFSDFSVEYEGW